MHRSEGDVVDEPVTSRRDPSPVTPVRRPNPLDEIERIQDGEDEVVPGEDIDSMLKRHDIW
jgi:hypothetical protein